MRTVDRLIMLIWYYPSWSCASPAFQISCSLLKRRFREITHCCQTRVENQEATSSFSSYSLNLYPVAGCRLWTKAALALLHALAHQSSYWVNNKTSSVLPFLHFPHISVITFFSWGQFIMSESSDPCHSVSSYLFTPLSALLTLTPLEVIRSSNMAESSRRASR